MKVLVVFLLIASSVLFQEARASSISFCQAQQLTTVQAKIESDGPLSYVFRGGFAEISFEVDDGWEQPVVRATATALPNAAACMVRFRLEAKNEVLGCPEYEAIEDGMSCPELCKSCGLELDRPKEAGVKR